MTTRFTNCKGVGWHYIAMGAIASKPIKDLRQDRGEKSLGVSSNCGSWAKACGYKKLQSRAVQK
jgi:hypothetical protein